MGTISFNYTWQGFIMPAILFIVTVLLGLNINEDDVAPYVKQYVVSVYIGLSLLSTVRGLPGWILVLYLFVITLFASINVGYYAGSLEKRLGIMRLAIFHFFGLFFRAKTYIAIVFLAAFYLKTIFAQHHILTFGYFGVAMTFHLFSNMRDQFGYQRFDKVRFRIRTLNCTSKKLGERAPVEHSILKLFQETSESFCDPVASFLDMLCFIVFIEDRDYFVRRLPVFSFWLVIKRKLASKTKGQKKGDASWWDRIVRGHSTIEQQIMRKTALVDSSYYYTVRRKLFIEYIYNLCFRKAFLKQEERIRNLHTTILLVCECWSSKGRAKLRLRRSKARLLHDELKIRYLLYYYSKILGSPITIDECLMKISSISNQNRTYLEKQYRFLFEKAIFYETKNELESALNRIKIIN